MNINKYSALSIGIISLVASQIAFAAVDPASIHGQFGGGVCGLDTAGGTKTAVSGGYFNTGGAVAGQDPSIFPAGFFDDPSHYCYQDTETWVNQNSTIGGDTVNAWGWYHYNAPYTNDPTRSTVFPTGKPGQNNIKENWAFTGVPPVAVTASLVANPNAIVRGESSLLTWSSTGATSCTGTNFSTSGATAGSLSVSPQQTTTYSVTCSGTGGSATANTTVSVTTASAPEFTVSCRVNPSSAKTNENVLWTSTVTGGQGAYAYSWSGSESLSGSGNQVSKKYTTAGTKTASLTVTYTPSVQTTQSPTTQTSTPPPTTSSTPPPQLGNVCPTIGWVTPVSPCNGSWAPTYNTSGCQSGWQCVAGSSGGGGGTVTPTTDTGGGVIDYINSFFAPTTNKVPESQTVDGSVLGATAGEQTKTVQCENSASITVPPPPQCSDGIDNDHNGHQDYPGDSNCDGPDDDNEYDDTPPQCSDDVDNGDPEDTLADYPHDPGCSSALDDDETDFTPPPQCSDGIDNDGDGKVDAADGGCASGGGGGGGGGGYNPNDNDESGGGITQCTAGNFCKGSDVYSRSTQCVESFVKSCPFGCSNGECISPPAGDPTIDFKASPPLIKKGQSCSLNVSATAVSSCTVSGSGLSVTLPATDGIVSASTLITPGLQRTTSYTLTCTGLNGATVSKKVDCKIAPTYQEF